MRPMHLTLILSMLLLTACGSAQQAPAQAPAIKVSVVAIQPERATLTSRLSGRTAAFRVADIRPQVSGLLLKRLFEEGSTVTAGQALYQIDPAPYKAAMENAQASLVRAEASRLSTKARADRLTSLLAQKLVSQQDYDDAAATLAQVEAEIVAWKAQVETARINLGYTTITASIAGRIGRSLVTEGAIVTAYQAQALATIQQLDPMYVDVTQSTADLQRIRRSVETGRLQQSAGALGGVTLYLDDGSRFPQVGELRFRETSVNPTTGAVVVRLVFSNPNGVLLPDMFVRTEIGEGVDERAILVPQTCVMRNAKGEPYVFTVDGDSKASRRIIDVQREIGSSWLVSGGLAAGDQVVIEGLQILQMMPPGAPLPVTATPFVPAAPTLPSAAAPAPAAK